MLLTRESSVSVRRKHESARNKNSNASSFGEDANPITRFVPQKMGIANVARWGLERGVLTSKISRRFQNDAWCVNFQNQQTEHLVSHSTQRRFAKQLFQFEGAQAPSNWKG